MNILLVGGVAALIALGGQAFWISTLRQEVAREVKLKDAAIQAGATCSDNTRILAEAGDVALAEAEAEREAALQRAATATQRANRIINAPPAVAGDACASADATFNSWLQERRK